MNTLWNLELAIQALIHGKRLFAESQIGVFN